MTTIHVTPNFDGGHEVKVQSKDPQALKCAIETLKSFVKVSHRTYDPDTKRWTVNESGYKELTRWTDYCRQNIGAEIKQLYADDDQEEYEQSPPPRQRQPRLDPYAALHLLPSAPPEVVKAAYRALAQINHPDHGGDTQNMQRINAAYKQLAA